MSYLFFLTVGILWGLLCAVCDVRGWLRNHRPLMQLACGLLSYGVAALIFWGQPAGGHWILHLILVVTVSGIIHAYSRTRLNALL